MRKAATSECCNHSEITLQGYHITVFTLSHVRGTSLWLTRNLISEQQLKRGKPFTICEVRFREFNLQEENAMSLNADWIAILFLCITVAF